MRFELARALADAVLLEGYALYPYRASAPKNHYRWTFGVLLPREWSEAGGSEPWWLEARVLVAGEPRDVAAQLRFFQIERRTTLVGNAPAWDEGVVHTTAVAIPSGASEMAIVIPGGYEQGEHAGDPVVRERLALSGRILVRRDQVAGACLLQQITIRVENTTPWHALDASRQRALAAAMASTHLLIGVEGGELLSAIDPPGWASSAASSCICTRTYPVLAGPPGAHDVMLCAPFIMYDHPQLAPESAGDLCDATEIDELLALRTRTLTDDEKRLVRETDARAAHILDRAEALSNDCLARMHGATRELVAGEMVPREVPPPTIGSKVRLKPPGPSRRTDAQDVLYAGHLATVMAVRHDVDGSMFLALTIDDDPAAELHDWYGRYHYYRTDEVEPA
jgi:hypothetical protein